MESKKLVARLEGMGRILSLRYGKKDFANIDLVESLSRHLKKSKSEVKRVIDAGGVDITIVYDEKVEYKEDGP